MFSWKTTCALCPEGENGEVRTDAGTQTVFWLKILILLSLNKGTLTRPSAIAYSIHLRRSLKGQSILTFQKNKCARVEIVLGTDIWLRSVCFEAMTLLVFLWLLCMKRAKHSTNGTPMQWNCVVKTKYFMVKALACTTPRDLEALPTACNPYIILSFRDIPKSLLAKNHYCTTTKRQKQIQ